MPSGTPLVIAADAWAGDLVGGQYKVASELAEHCAAAGRRVHYVCADAAGRGSTAMEHGVTVWRYPVPAGNAARKLLAHLRGVAAVLRAICAQLDGAFVFNGHSQLPYYAGLRIRGLPIARRVASVHSPLAREYRANCGDVSGLGERSMEIAFRHLERVSYRRSDLVQCFSRYTAGLLRGDFGRELRSLEVCPGYVDFDRMALDMPRAEARSRLAMPCWQTDDLCFFSLRRHARRMGLDTLIRAWARMRDRGDLPVRRRLILGGEGPETPRLQELTQALGVHRSVHFVGAVEESKKALHYRAADCFVLPTRALEGFGLIVLEAFAAGIPVIATPVGAIPETVEGYGWLAKGGDEQALEEALAKFLRDPALDRAAEERLRQHARSFDKSVVLPRLESLIMGQAA